MNLSVLAREYCSATNRPRISPVSRCASLLTFILLTIGVVASIATSFMLTSLPNVLLLVLGVLILDVLIQFAPQVRIVEAIQTVLYAVLYLVVTCVCGVLAAYSLQRMAFPLQDQFLTAADKALGFDWFGYAHWIDRHEIAQMFLRRAYDSIALQIALPVIVLAFANRLDDLRVYLLSFSIAFVLTIIVSALMPAAGPIGALDHAAFNILRFTGATPVDHLTRLREAGPLIMNEFPGGIATFPSFHSTVAVLTPLVLRGYPRLFAILVVVNAAMLAGTITEGAHYLIDVVAGTGMAFFGYFAARRMIRLEDRAFYRQYDRPISAYSSAC